MEEEEDSEEGEEDSEEEEEEEMCLPGMDGKEEVRTRGLCNWQISRMTLLQTAYIVFQMLVSLKF